MSNGRTHRAVGTVAGGRSALAKARPQSPEHVLLEILGGLVGGNMGARLQTRSIHPTTPVIAVWLTGLFQ